MLLDLVKALLPPNKATRIIDIGCGVGGNTAALDERYDCLGIDASPLAIDAAKNRHPKTRFILGDSPTALIGEAAASLFLLADVLEHVRDDRALLSAWVALAPPGAWFVVTAPADPSLWSPHDEAHGHYRRYDRASLARLFDGLPLETTLVTPFNTRLYGVIKRRRARAQRSAAPSGAFVNDMKAPPLWVNRCLESLLYGETNRLLRELRQDQSPSSKPGVSLVAVLRKSCR